MTPRRVRPTYCFLAMPVFSDHFSRSPFPYRPALAQAPLLLLVDQHLPTARHPRAARCSRGRSEGFKKRDYTLEAQGGVATVLMVESRAAPCHLVCPARQIGTGGLQIPTLTNPSYNPCTLLFSSSIFNSSQARTNLCTLGKTSKL